MNTTKRTLFNFLLGAITCMLIVGVSNLPLSNVAWSVPAQPESIELFPSRSLEIGQMQQPINQHLMADLQEAESVLMAQSMSDSSMQRYVTILTKNNIVPNPPSTSATGVAGAVLMGDRLVVRGDFGSLTSALRDYTTDPLNPPNPNITSAVHIHRGAPTENGPFQYALTVVVNKTGIGGRFMGEYTLTSEQLQALADGKLYVDIHTKKNRAGELRGVFRQI
ncbi:CHRD domain-containing protein [Leptothermofonsia sp. ETS-13]|uniref:CHRD domain-containing protein n=1 Tax=Leptothermofonsia sp. ETS-13 TaxID=3035696 RepID=UPI003B9DCF00